MRVWCVCVCVLFEVYASYVGRINVYEIVFVEINELSSVIRYCLVNRSAVVFFCCHCVVSMLSVCVSEMVDSWCRLVVGTVLHFTEVHLALFADSLENVGRIYAAAGMKSEEKEMFII